MNAAASSARLGFVFASLAAVLPLAGFAQLERTSQQTTLPEVPYVACPARLDVVVTVGEGRYGIAVSRSDAATRAVRIFIDTDKSSYTVTFDALTFERRKPVVRFMTISAPETITSVWIDGAGKDAAHLTGCSVPSPSVDDDNASIEARQKAGAAAIRSAAATTNAASTPASRAPGGCFQPNSEPKVIFASPPQTVPGVSGTTEVVITLEPDSVQRAVAVYRSSGNETLDKLAIEATRRSRFVTEVRDCRPMAKTFRFIVDFVARPE